MNQFDSLLTMLLIAWGITTAVLVVLVIYRGTLSSREDDQIFIAAGEQHHYQEQEAIIAKMTQLSRPIIALMVISGVLLLTSAGIWVYQGFTSF
jgi:hypothetical protein